MFNALKFYRDYGIEIATQGHKRTRPGWIQITCPFCRGTYALGFATTSGVFNCWKCGQHDVLKVIQAVLGKNKNQALQIVQQYKTTGRHQPTLVQDDIKPRLRRECDWPLDCHEMKARHRAYLEKRNFDPTLLEQVFGLRGTGPIGDYSHRIIIPIYLDNRMISFQGRDITGKCEQGVKYMACPKAFEAIDHKHSLYAIDLVPGDSAVIVEGAADVWRLGPGAVGTFGTGFTKVQQNLFRKRFRRGFLLFDPEPIAQQKAEKCAQELAILGISTEIVELEEGDDPGDLSQQDADYIMKTLLGPTGGWNG